MRNPKKVPSATFLEHRQLLWWAEHLIRFAESDDPAEYGRSLETGSSEDARERGDPRWAMRVTAGELYRRIQLALRPLLQQIGDLPRGERVKWPEGWRKFARLRSLCIAGPLVTVSGRAVFDEHGQRLYGHLFESVPAAFCFVAADLLNPMRSVRIRRCECALFD